MKTLVIIGNAVVEKDYSEFVDNAEFVVRFNWLNNFNKNTGTRTDAISLATAKQHFYDYLYPPLEYRKEKYPDFCETINNVDTLIFPIPDANRSCHMRLQRIVSFTSHFSLHAKTIKKYFCEDIYYETLKEYGWSSNFIAPSSGYTLIRNILDDDEFRGYKIHIMGFSWEGWEGHPWLNEKKVIKQLSLQNKLTLLM